jgi:hypothetical protein
MQNEFITKRNDQGEKSATAHIPARVLWNC